MWSISSFNAGSVFRLLVNWALQFYSWLFVRRATLLVSFLVAIIQIQAQTQTAMNAQARADFAQADVDLNKTYQVVLEASGCCKQTKAKGKTTSMARVSRCRGSTRCWAGRWRLAGSDNSL